jgi:hypothetical protein
MILPFACQLKFSGEQGAYTAKDGNLPDFCSKILNRPPIRKAVNYVPAPKGRTGKTRIGRSEEGVRMQVCMR